MAYKTAERKGVAGTFVCVLKQLEPPTCEGRPKEDSKYRRICGCDASTRVAVSSELEDRDRRAALLEEHRAAQRKKSQRRRRRRRRIAKTSAATEVASMPAPEAADAAAVAASAEAAAL